MNNIFNLFMYWYNEYFYYNISEMRKCMHEHIAGEPNPYHSEGDVWSHTVGVYTSLKCLSNNTSHFNFKNIVLAISGLTHDWGKVFTRNVTNTSKVTFYGHADYSVQHAIDVTYKFFKKIKEENIIIDDCKIDDVLPYIINIVGNHMKFYTYTPEKYNLLSNYDNQLLNMFYEFEQSDINGSYPIKSQEICLKRFENNKPFNKDEIDIWVYMGIPGSGKDTHAQQSGLPIISLDKARIMAYYDMYNITEDMNPDALYSKAFEYVSKNNIDLNPYIIKQMDKLNTSKFAICNTNISIKSRKFVLNQLKNKYSNSKIGCRYMVCSTETCIERDINRKSKDKLIGEHIIKRIGSKIEPPTLCENFDFIDYVIT